ncbi:hypothetical protein B0T19DRAFT_469306 [Cercophora scortea]|uniref:DUF7136 domain-containing protein n=1 Tax=Cercophora scortea TaxID=314031 RepID=A0AAE0I3H4_9PEZI|nr:hypothetical protein B0T19DRAFT_469306 [Cercophora scortea]
MAWLSATPARSALAPSSLDTVELDLISPVKGGHYRVNPDTGLGVVAAVHNKALADSHEWSFGWEIRSSEPKFFAMGTIGGRPEGPREYDESDFSTIQNDTIYIGVSHPYFFSGSNRPNNGPMPAGQYRFNWRFDIGPWCGPFRVTNGSPGTNGSQGWDTVFKISVADDAPWPAFTPTSCASVAGQVSFATSPAVVGRHVSPEESYASTLSVTESANPCLATVGPAQAASISSVMKWGSAARTPVTSSSLVYWSSAFSSSSYYSSPSSPSSLSVTQMPSSTPTDVGGARSRSSAANPSLQPETGR